MFEILTEFAKNFAIGMLWVGGALGFSGAVIGSVKLLTVGAEWIVSAIKGK